VVCAGAEAYGRGSLKRSRLLVQESQGTNAIALSFECVDSNILAVVNIEQGRTVGSKEAVAETVSFKIKYPRSSHASRSIFESPLPTTLWLYLVYRSFQSSLVRIFQSSLNIQHPAA
jgi:hypothetical protein